MFFCDLLPYNSLANRKDSSKNRVTLTSGRLLFIPGLFDLYRYLHTDDIQ